MFEVSEPVDDPSLIGSQIIFRALAVDTVVLDGRKWEYSLSVAHNARMEE
jgi:hypothetical protein